MARKSDRANDDLLLLWIVDALEELIHQADAAHLVDLAENLRDALSKATSGVSFHVVH